MGWILGSSPPIMGKNRRIADRLRGDVSRPLRTCCMTSSKVVGLRAGSRRLSQDEKSDNLTDRNDSSQSRRCHEQYRSCEVALTIRFLTHLIRSRMR